MIADLCAWGMGGGRAVLALFGGITWPGPGVVVRGVCAGIRWCDLLAYRSAALRPGRGNWLILL